MPLTEKDLCHLAFKQILLFHKFLVMVQVMEVTKRWPGVSKISFIAHSLGGLVARYAIGRLYENSSSEAKIAGLQPVNFITVATPHLGSRGHKQVSVDTYLSKST